MKRYTTCLIAIAALTAFGIPDHCYAKKTKKSRHKKSAPAVSAAPIAPAPSVPSLQAPPQAAPAPAVAAAPALIQQALGSLSAYAALQSALGVQNADLAVAMRKALMAAELLIGSDGVLNTDLCASILSAFVPAQPKEWEANMGKVLQSLDASWKPFFDSIRAPENSSGANVLALRALFSIDPSQPLTDRQAKVAVLAALFAPYNQGPVGDCFAVADAIRNHSEYYRHAAEDYRSIVMHGNIERSANGISDYFFFLPTLADGDRDQIFELTSSGAFVQGGYALFDAPGFAAARRMMGGDGFSHLLQDVMALLTVDAQGSSIQVTPSQVIDAIAQAIGTQLCSPCLETLSAAGRYAFSGLTNNTVLRAVESAYAAMAEDRPNDSTRGNINSCVAQSFQSTWNQLKKVKDASQFQQAFTEAFDVSYRLVYNQDIPLAHVSADGSSFGGGFQLYQRIPGRPDQMGVPVETPQEFRQLIVQAVASIEAELDTFANAQKIASRLTSVAQTDGFLKSVLWSYDPANRQEADPIGNYLKFARTPMQSCNGDNPYEVDDIDTGASYEKDVQTYTPNNAKDLIMWCLNLAKKAPAELIPMDSPQHAFNFVPANPDISAFLKKGMPTSQWLQNCLVVPGMQISRRPMDSPTSQALVAEMGLLLQQTLSDLSDFQSLASHLDQQKLTVRDYTNALIRGINHLLESDPNQARQIALIVDQVLIKSLPANDQSILGQSAIRFAFTNWNEGAEDVYFCAFFNPRTEAIGFGSIFEDKTHLQPMDEEAWVNHQRWDVDLTPAEPVSV